MVKELSSGVIFFWWPDGPTGLRPLMWDSWITLRQTTPGRTLL